jgi:ribonuclease/clavin/mitogillin
MNDYSLRRTKMKIRTFNELTQGQIFLKPYSLSVCFYHIDGLLIDTGAPSHRKELQDYYKGQRLEQVALTHHHEDHSGLADWLESEMNLPIFMMSETREILNNPPKIPLYRRVTWGQMNKVQGQNIGSKVETDHFSFEVIHTPGHCSDHISLLEPNQGFLFSGDLFVASRIKYSLREESLLAMLNSINKLLRYDFEVVFCAHAGRVKNGRRAFEQKKEFLENLIDQVLHHHKQGLALREIRSKIYPKMDWIHYFSAGEFSSHNVIRLIIEEFGTPSHV